MAKTQIQLVITSHDVIELFTVLLTIVASEVGILIFNLINIDIYFDIFTLLQLPRKLGLVILDVLTFCLVVQQAIFEDKVAFSPIHGIADSKGFEDFSLEIFFVNALNEILFLDRIELSRLVIYFFLNYVKDWVIESVRQWHALLAQVLRNQDLMTLRQVYQKNLLGEFGLSQEYLYNGQAT